MNWREYADDIELFSSFDRNFESMSEIDKKRCVKVLIYYFSKDNSWKVSRLPDTYSQRREILRGLLNTYPPRKIDQNILNLVHKLLISELKEKNLVNVNNLSEIEKGISIWKGDITTLIADAIVNAANCNLLGCLKPLHECIDNSIHSNAGPMLREDCNKIIEKQGHIEYTGNAKITRGYCLPSRYVIHTVGPMIRSNSPTKEQEKQLISSYKSCLNLANEIDNINNIVFPCISTGVFGYQKEKAAIIAVDTVKDWIKENSNKVSKVVFNVFSNEDEEIYREILE